jgi:AcrR family transcriptional regulator
MDEIASGLQVSKKTIYKHFSSKEFIVNAVVEELMKSLQGKLEEIINSDADSVDKMVKLYQLIGQFLLRVSNKWINDLRIHQPLLWEKVDEFRTNRFNRSFSSIIEKGKTEKLIKGYPVDLLVMLLTSSLRGVINNEVLLKSRFSYHDAIETSLEVLFNGILTNKGQKILNKKLLKV